MTLNPKKETCLWKETIDLLEYPHFAIESSTHGFLWHFLS